MHYSQSKWFWTKARTPQLQELGTVLSQYVVAVGFLIENKLLIDQLPIPS